jgi:hypothetical protein
MKTYTLNDDKTFNEIEKGKIIRTNLNGKDISKMETRFNKIIDGKLYDWEFNMDEFSEGDIMIHIKNEDQLSDFISHLIRKESIIHKTALALYARHYEENNETLGIRCLKKMIPNSDYIEYYFVEYRDIYEYQNDKNITKICEFDKIYFK